MSADNDALNIFRGFFLGFIKIHVLHHASEEPIYGLAMIEELGRHGYDISAGTLYPMLRSLEKDGLLRKQNRVIGGRVRKYYTATDQGLHALAEIKLKLVELSEEVLEGKGPKSLPDPGTKEEEIDADAS